MFIMYKDKMEEKVRKLAHCSLQSVGKKSEAKPARRPVLLLTDALSLLNLSISCSISSIALKSHFLR